MRLVDACLFALFGGAIVFCSVLLYMMENEPTGYESSLEAYNSITNNSVEGVYFPQGAIVIHTNKKSMERMNELVAHEYLHYLVMTNSDEYKHFCWVD